MCLGMFTFSLNYCGFSLLNSPYVGPECLLNLMLCELRSYPSLMGFHLLAFFVAWCIIFYAFNLSFLLDFRL
jgi:hypothetical protein